MILTTSLTTRFGVKPIEDSSDAAASVLNTTVRMLGRSPAHWLGSAIQFKLFFANARVELLINWWELVRQRAQRRLMIYFIFLCGVRRQCEATKESSIRIILSQNDVCNILPCVDEKECNHSRPYASSRLHSSFRLYASDTPDGTSHAKTLVAKNEMLFEIKLL